MTQSLPWPVVTNHPHCSTELSHFGNAGYAKAGARVAPRGERERRQQLPDRDILPVDCVRGSRGIPRLQSHELRDVSLVSPKRADAASPRDGEVDLILARGGPRCT